ncbi:MAG TPA: type II toxin-antitoxin system VapC family toxin [Nitrosomonas mobilis]|nr:type II toxin-antitoxin system VapC family toxin [Nitrosomonas mobilis]
MLLLLDTHALIWLDQDDPSLGTGARDLANTALQHGKLAVSAITFWETAMLAAKGRITMTLPLPLWRRDFLELGLVEIGIDGDIGIAVAQLDLHGDPADRLIVATAQLIDATLLTADLSILQWNTTLKRFDARQ